MTPTDLLAHNARIDDRADIFVLIAVILCGIIGVAVTWL